MAALRIFARSVISPITQLYNNAHNTKYIIAPIIQINKRLASFKTSPVYNEENKYTDYEISQDPAEWSYVERLFKPKFIPTPPKYVDVTASGWKSPKDDAKKLPYFVRRTKNHMQPVYIHRKNRCLRQLTVVRKIEGDIIALEADLKKYIEDVSKLKVGSQISEPGGIIKFRGDFASIIKKWLDQHGF